jgi:hypothetical protein
MRDEHDTMAGSLPTGGKLICIEKNLLIKSNPDYHGDESKLSSEWVVDYSPEL